MTNFFRKIRQQHFIKNKFTKYLVYAFGEILLVVIGILIALQVNNLNEKRKSDIKEKKYLMSMKNELLTNLELVKTEVEGLKRSINGQRELISLINSEKDTVNEIELSKILAVSFSNVFELKYQDGTFKELLYSGGLISINSDRIKNEVTSWEGRMIDIRKQEKGVYDAREKIIDFIIDNGVFKIMLDDVGASNHFQIRKSIRRNSNKLLLKSQKFENLLSYHIALNESQKYYYLRLENDISNLLRLVEKELNKN
ncbi:DUF6090 family protein [Aquimarina algiphila]|uniref:DUF6090 family protein n=1 Tax=Aquimarina algiphila TaxID=2047982 RepID=UPI00232C5328|nr:DUF6090 family protein [Aquimarina algiphila]